MVECKEKFEKIVQVRANSYLSLKNANGDVKVRSWEQNTVKVMATKRCWAFTSDDARRKTDQVKIDINQKDDKVSIDTIYPRHRWFGISIGIGNTAQVDYLLCVPRKINLDLKTLNGTVFVKDIIGEVNSKTYNGRGTIRNVKGCIALSSLNGALELIKLTSAKIEAHTLHGSIKADICVIKNGKYHLKTLNGSIDVSIPLDSSIRILAKTLNGEINHNLPLTKLKSSRGKLEGILKADEAYLDLDALNGSINMEGYEYEAEYTEPPEEEQFRQEKVERATSEDLEEEKATILKLVREGKITADEAKKLFEVMGINSEGLEL